MGFYEQISKYYDYIFPIEESQVKFIEGVLKDKPGSETSTDKPDAFSKQNVLDVACGSGGYAIELSKLGFNVTAVDLDEAMLEMAAEKARKEKLDIDIVKCDIRELKKTLLNENIRKNKENGRNNDIGSKEQGKLFDCIFCIGNSIVHLGSYDEILQSLKQMLDLLAIDGVLVLQIINYDRIINLGIKELPAIKNEKIALEFIRKYEFSNSSGLVNFNTLLTIGNGDEKEKYENSVQLYPIRSGEMLKLLYDSGFNEVEFYGDFDKSPFKEDSYMLVVKASRK
jgi:2-polyprenyl-3-methyl-5-hydroxy-6-metoxy-1,4-benzoquinol methylase